MDRLTLFNKKSTRRWPPSLAAFFTFFNTRQPYTPPLSRPTIPLNLFPHPQRLLFKDRTTLRYVIDVTPTSLLSLMVFFTFSVPKATLQSPPSRTTISLKPLSPSPMTRQRMDHLPPHLQRSLFKDRTTLGDVIDVNPTLLLSLLVYFRV